MVLIPISYCMPVQGESKITLLKEARIVSDEEVSQTAKCESKKNRDGGYDAHPCVVDCFAEMSYEYTGGRYINEPIRFRMLKPDQIEDGKEYPAIISFHGVGESGNDNTRQLSHIQLAMEYLAGKNKLDFFLIITQCPIDNQSWENSVSIEGKGDAPLTIAEEILEAVMNEYPIDENRVSVLGICSGGNAAWNFVSRHPDRFASAVVCSSTPPTSLDLSHFTKTVFWIFADKYDKQSLGQTQQFINTVNTSGGNAWLTPNKKGGHDTWTTALAEYEVIGWMVMQNRMRGSPPPGVICHHRSTKELFFRFGFPILVFMTAFVFSCYRSRSHKKQGGIG